MNRPWWAGPVGIPASQVLLARDAIRRIAQALAEPPAELRARKPDFRM